MHLALTHVPVILSMVGLIMLVVALIIKNTTLTKSSYYILVIAGLTAVPVYFSGEEAEEAVEHIKGISESLIEEHEEIAKFAMIAIAATGILSLAALIIYHLKQLENIFKSAVLIMAIIAAGLMFRTAHLGGQIRHTEINGEISLQSESNNPGVDKNDNLDNEEDD